MKSYKKNTIFFIITFFFCLHTSNAQSIVGVIFYKVNTIKEKPKEIAMFFDNTTSIYIYGQGPTSSKAFFGNGEEIMNPADKELLQAQINRMMNAGQMDALTNAYRVTTDPEGNVVYKNWREDSILVRENGKYATITYESPIPKIKWEILNESKKIGNFNCQKAITNFRGRKYIAWFTLLIPVPYGPWKLHGLPGLILEASDEENKYQYTFQSIEIPLKDKSMLSHKPKTGTRVYHKEYRTFKEAQLQQRERIANSAATTRGNGGSVTMRLNELQELTYE